MKAIRFISVAILLSSTQVFALGNGSGGKAPTPKQCYDTINSSMTGMVGIAKSVANATGDGGLITYMSTGKPAGFAMKDESAEALKKQGMALMGLAGACSATCSGNVNVELDKLCRLARGIISLDGKKLAPFIESNGGVNGFSAKVKAAYNTMKVPPAPAPKRSNKKADTDLKIPSELNGLEGSETAI